MNEEIKDENVLFKILGLLVVFCIVVAVISQKIEFDKQLKEKINNASDHNYGTDGKMYFSDEDGKKYLVKENKPEPTVRIKNNRSKDCIDYLGRFDKGIALDYQTYLSLCPTNGEYSELSLQEVLQLIIDKEGYEYYPEVKEEKITPAYIK